MVTGRWLLICWVLSGCAQESNGALWLWQIVSHHGQDSTGNVLVFEFEFTCNSYSQRGNYLWQHWKLWVWRSTICIWWWSNNMATGGWLLICWALIGCTKESNGCQQGKKQTITISPSTICWLSCLIFFNYITFCLTWPVVWSLGEAESSGRSAGVYIVSELILNCPLPRPKRNDWLGDSFPPPP